MWKVDEELRMVDLRNDFYLIGFKLLENYLKVLGGEGGGSMVHRAKLLDN